MTSFGFNQLLAAERGGPERSPLFPPVGAETWLTGVAPAQASTRFVAGMVDAALVVLSGCLGVGLALGAGWATQSRLVLGLVVALGAIALNGVLVARTGQSVGHRFLRQRAVDRDSGAAPRVGAIALALLSESVVVADLRLGRDPFTLVGRPLRVPKPSTPSPAPLAQVRYGRLVGTDGVVIDVRGPVVLGRRPTELTGRGEAVALTDLSRQMSLTHTLVEPGVGGLQVHDLGSTNGTVVTVPGAAPVLLRKQMMTAPFGALIGIGGVTVRVAGQNEGVNL